MLRIESDTVFSLWDGFRALSLCRQKKIHNTIKERHKHKKQNMTSLKQGSTWRPKKEMYWWARGRKQTPMILNCSDVQSVPLNSLCAPIKVINN